LFISTFPAGAKMLATAALLMGSSLLAKDTLATLDTLLPRDVLTSENGDYTAGLQEDGNFVVIQGGKEVVWSAGTQAVSGYLVMQKDNNFALYDKDCKSAWSTKTWNEGTPGQGTVVMGNDGALVVTCGQKVLWSSKKVAVNLGFGGGRSRVDLRVELNREGVAKVDAAVKKAGKDVKEALKEDCLIQ
jgi:hypothetical protein